MDERKVFLFLFGLSTLVLIIVIIAIIILRLTDIPTGIKSSIDNSISDVFQGIVNYV